MFEQEDSWELEKDAAKAEGGELGRSDGKAEVAREMKAMAFHMGR